MDYGKTKDGGGWWRGFYATRSFQTYLHKELLIDLLHPRVEIKPTRHKYYQNKHITNVNYTTVICIILLLLSGDVSLNPGPVKFPCGTCEKGVRRNQRAIQCDDCNLWFHLKCIDLLLTEYELLGNSTDSWFCKKCYLPDFSDSFLLIWMRNQTHQITVSRLSLLLV